MSEADWCRVIEREITTVTITSTSGLRSSCMRVPSPMIPVVIVLVAASGVGKSTATLGLARRVCGT
ncbi:MAG: hypothetical protein IPH03_08890 [Tetrasphaera sp.]|nr:hypothetical protein [Tetrasphaera sp.]